MTLPTESETTQILALRRQRKTVGEIACAVFPGDLPSTADNKIRAALAGQPNWMRFLGGEPIGRGDGLRICLNRSER